MMKPLLIPAIWALAAGLFFVSGPTSMAEPIREKPGHVSLKNEVQLSIDRGLSWLKSQQKPDGTWSNADHPALTCLPLLAFERNPQSKFQSPDSRPDFLEKGYAFVRSLAKPDGGIYSTGLSNYNTSLALVCLLTRNLPADEPLITKARSFIIGQQAKGMTTESLDGGIGYGPTGVSPKRQHPDLDNTLIALEALRTYRTARPNAESEEDLDWNAAIQFLSRTQNLPESNPAGSKDPANRGGFVYYPGYSNADPTDGSKPLRSYGSMTYAGLLSFIYADLKSGDPRVQAAEDWLRKNFSLEENPGMGRAGLYYYYHLMAKGLAATGLESLELSNGSKLDWAPALAKKLLDLQQGDGSWVNDTGRWMEKDPVLVTAYCLLALETIASKL
jgi:squalene-hopene/tetraprenyl-beta-curcumene cyclase